MRQDPLRKDALELLLRLFDREGLKLIPALEFASPLPELEALCSAAAATRRSGIEWIGADGDPWAASRAPRQGLAPYYNLLDPRVAASDAQASSAKLAARYAAHPSFGGLALQLSADGYAQLPGERLGVRRPDDRPLSSAKPRRAFLALARSGSPSGPSI